MSESFGEKCASWARVLRVPLLLTVNVEAFGNTAEEIYLGLLRARREKRKIIFIFVWDLFSPFVFSKSGRGINKALKRVESPHLFFRQDNPVQVFLNAVTTGIYCSLKLVWSAVIRLPGIRSVDPRESSLMGRFCRVCVRPPSVGQKKLWEINTSSVDDYSQLRSNWVEQFEEHLEVFLRSEDEQIGQDLAKSLGLEEDRPYVCLHVRETGYYGSTEGKGKTLRNGSIENFLPAIKFLVEQKFTVVRIGDSSMTPLPRLRGVIDYPFTEKKCDLMDVWLIAHCEFFFGHNSGPNDVAYLFQKPTLIPNITLFAMGNPVHAGSLCLLKHVYSKNKERYLSVEELVELYLLNETSPLRDPDLVFVENTADELEELVREYIQSNVGDASRTMSNLQKTVLERRWDIEKSFLRDPKLAEPSIFKASTRKARYLSRLLGCSGAISEGYLQRNYREDALN